MIDFERFEATVSLVVKGLGAQLYSKTQPYDGDGDMVSIGILFNGHLLSVYADLTVLPASDGEYVGEMVEIFKYWLDEVVREEAEPGKPLIRLVTGVGASKDQKTQQ